MARQNLKALRLRRNRTEPYATDLGPAWMPLRQAFTTFCEAGEPNATATMLADAVTSGRLTVFTDFLWRADPESWDDGSVSRKQAESLGLTIPDLAGPTGRSLALSPLFWQRTFDLASALVSWPESDSLELPETSGDAGPKAPKSFVWDVGRPTVSTLQVELLSALIGLGSYSPPKPPRVGRHRSEKWNDWTAQLVQQIHEDGVSPTIDAGQLAAILEGKMQARFKEAPDRTSARITLETVIAHSASYIEGPEKS